MGAMASLITGASIVYSTVCSCADQIKISKLRATGLCEGNSSVTGEFPAQRASNAENVSILWRHHDITSSDVPYFDFIDAKYLHDIFHKAKQSSP